MLSEYSANAAYRRSLEMLEDDDFWVDEDLGRDHEKRLEREQAMFDTSVEQVTNLFGHFIEEVTDSQEAAATLALAAVMNLEEME